MYVIMFRGQPIACAEQFERCQQQIELYTQTQRINMHVVAVPLLD